MAKSRKYRCPDCSGVFTYLHHPNEQEDPVRFCPRCGWDAQAEANGERAELGVEIEAPHVQNAAVVKGADNVYRAMEEASQHHVYAAAEAAGCDASDMASLAITDMKDNLREGDIAAAPIQNSVTEIMRAVGPTGALGAGAAPAQAAQYAAAAHTGSDAFAGLRAASGLREAHSRIGGGALSSNITPLEITNRTVAPHLSRLPAAGGRSAARRR